MDRAGGRGRGERRSARAPLRGRGSLGKVAPAKPAAPARPAAYIGENGRLGIALARGDRSRNSFNQRGGIYSVILAS